MTKRLQLLERFGRLRVLIPEGKTKRPDETYKPGKTALCLCDCGALVAVRKHSLERGGTRSCGCLAREMASGKNYKHGKSWTAEHRAWVAARQRCNNPNDEKFERYGARGIKVCAEWDEFEQFFKDMGLRPSLDHSLERVDVNGNYCAENCIWATREVQQNNKRTNVYVMLNGVRMTMTQAARKLNFSANLARGRRQKGWHPHRWFEPAARVWPVP